MVERKQIKEAIKKAKEAKDRKFTQTIELFVKLKGYNPKKDGEISLLVNLPKIHKSPKICGIVGPELLDGAKKECDNVITEKEIDTLKPAKAKKLAREYDFFIAQAQLMPTLAKKMGRILGPLGKMPNPKKGQVLSPKSDVSQAVTKLKNSVKLNTKKQKAIAVAVGDEKMKDEEILANIEAVLDTIKKNLPSSQSAIDKLVIKTTMGDPVKLR